MVIRLSLLDLLDRYLLGLCLRPLLVSLAVVMAALLLERILRLAELLTRHSGSLIDILLMAANLVPHYLGLALPAALFISVYLVVARLSEESELDAVQACGRSPRRLLLPFLLLAMLLATFSLLLDGWLQPYARYGYRALLHQVTQAVWDARVTPGTFIDIGDGFTVFADRADASGRLLSGIFIHQRNNDGSETFVTAERGELLLVDGGQRLALALGDATRVHTKPDGTTTALHLRNGGIARTFDRAIPPFRPRGADEREMTAVELWTASEPAQRAELHGRLVRAASMPLLPLLAFPMALVSRRTGRGGGIAVATVLLGLYHHVLQSAETMAGLGRIGVPTALWMPFAVLAVICTTLFLCMGRRRRRPWMVRA